MHSWKSLINFIILFALLLLLQIEGITALGEIIYAINAGGETHTDVHGIRYQRDPLAGKLCIASEFGKRLYINRIAPEDQILYQTERYCDTSFGYDIRIPRDGDYVLVLKFCEVYFTASNMKVFDVILNREHAVVSDLDLFYVAGLGTAHDEYIPFTISSDKLTVNGEESDFNGVLRVDFIKGNRDNPKINAMYVMQGSIDDVPKLPPIQVGTDKDDDNEEDNAEVKESQPSKNRRPSGPKTPDPYSQDESSMMLPVFIAIGAFIPVLFCLCKL